MSAPRPHGSSAPSRIRTESRRQAGEHRATRSGADAISGHKDCALAEGLDALDFYATHLHLAREGIGDLSISASFDAYSFRLGLGGEFDCFSLRCCGDTL